MVQGVPGERLLLLAKTPTTYNRLIKAGVPLKEVNLGGAGIRGERQPFINNVALNPEEVLACEESRKLALMYITSSFRNSQSSRLMMR